MIKDPGHSQKWASLSIAFLILTAFFFLSKEIETGFVGNSNKVVFDSPTGQKHWMLSILKNKADLMWSFKTRMLILFMIVSPQPQRI